MISRGIKLVAGSIFLITFAGNILGQDLNGFDIMKLVETHSVQAMIHHLIGCSYLAANSA